METKKQVKKILLVMPPVTISKEYTKEIQPPLGLAYIAAVLEKDYTVKILDAACEGWHTETQESDTLIRFGLPFETIQTILSDFAPDVVGVSCLFSLQRLNSHRICALAKKVDPNIITIMGGAHPTAMPAKTLEDTAVDMVILGEGELAMQETLHAIQEGGDLCHVDGLAYKKGGVCVINPKVRFIEDLDTLPLPARHLLPMKKYFQINLPHGVSTRYRPNTPLITSRGCPANCIFCSIHGIWGYKYRSRCAASIIAELRHLKETYGIREIQFEDDNLTFDKNRALELFQGMVRQQLNLAWTTPNGVALWSLDRELLAAMKTSGCYRLCLAIESGDQEFLNTTIRKPLNLQKVKELMHWVKAYGFESDAFFVVGFPHETKEQLHNTFRYADGLKTDNVSFYIATPYPGTELYDSCLREGYLTPDFSVDSLGVKKATINTDYYTAAEIEKLVAYYTLRHKITLLWRNPRAFYRKVIRRFFKTPGYFVTLTRKLLMKVLVKK